MFKRLSLVLLSLVVNSAWAIDAQKMVIEADKYRQSDKSMKVTSSIELYKNGELNKKKEYQIYVKPGQKSLVLMVSPSEKGQKVLMLGDKFWMLMPRSRRPIRITPMQKLLGEASTGDIATLNWNDDYQAAFLADETINGKRLKVLDLKAKRKGVSYKRIKLYLQEKSYKPEKAELYVASGKLAKIASYQIGLMKGREQVLSMSLQDKINKNKKTVIYYHDLQAFELADKYFNPSYLVKNPKIK